MPNNYRRRPYKKDDDKLKKMMMRNWLIAAISLAVIVLCRMLLSN